MDQQFHMTFSSINYNEEKIKQAQQSMTKTVFINKTCESTYADLGLKINEDPTQSNELVCMTITFHDRH